MCLILKALEVLWPSLSMQRPLVALNVINNILDEAITLHIFNLFGKTKTSRKKKRKLKKSSIECESHKIENAICTGVTQ